jgi:cyclophilin family peptidyl-prolyl cis-trans isomerase
MLDSLKTTLLNKKFYQESDWKKLLYKIKILSCYSDSLITDKIASYLKDENPHVRKEAISALGKIKSDYSKNILLHYYDQTGWTEKGIIILSLADRYPKFIYRLIQQNLDQGTIYFKEMLLQSLAKINDKMSRTQLKQFLNVPEPRLQAVAFEELDKLRRLSYSDVKPILLSGNNMLTSYATSWLTEHPQYANYEDLKTAYKKFSDPKDAETLITILETINALKLSKTIAFLDSVYLNTSHRDIAKTAATGLSNFDIKIEKRDFSSFSLFVPDSINYDSEPINITINTEKGDIGIELWPLDSPLTVSHFLYLIKKNYYKNLTFHRVVSDFVIQGGDPTGTGWGGPGYSIPCEYNDKLFIRGSIGMATAGKDTGGSQFFICHSEQPHLNRRYTNFGLVKNGMDVVDKITKDDKILNIIIN